LATWFRAVLVALMVGLAVDSAAKECIHSAFLDDISALITESETEYPKFEAGAFPEVSFRVVDEIVCLEGLADPLFVARAHRVLALRARVVDRDDVRARQGFAAARRLDPNYVMPTQMVAIRDPERAEYLAIPVEMITTTTVHQPTEASVWFDGEQTRERPSNVPTLMQLTNQAGQVVESHYLWPSDPTPAYLKVSTAVSVSQAREGKPAKVAFVATSAGIAGAGAALLLGGSLDKGSVCASLNSDECVGAANRRVLAGAVLSGVGLVGVTTGAVLLDVGPARVGARFVLPL